MSETIAPPSDVGNDEVLDWIRQYQSQKRVVDSENGVLRNVVKRAKSAGVNIKAMLATVTAVKDPDEIIRQIRDTLHYMSLKKMVVDRDDLFEGWSPQVTARSRMADDVWTAEDTGYKAGRHGADIAECPYDAGSELQVAWLKWHAKGQETIAKEMGPGGEQAKATKARKPRQARIPGTERRANGASRRASIISDAEQAPALN